MTCPDSAQTADSARLPTTRGRVLGLLVYATYVVLLVSACIGVACGPPGKQDGWVGVIDTTESGVLHIHNTKVGAWRAGEEWSLRAERRIGSIDGGGPDMFGGIRDIDVDSSGRIYVADAPSNEVRVFGPNGRHLVSFGRFGEGPGEFRFISGLAVDSSQQIWVADLRNVRYSVFTGDGKYLRSHRSTRSGLSLPWAGAIDSIGRVYDYHRAADESTRVARLDSAHTQRFPNELRITELSPIPVFDTPELTLRDPDGNLRASIPVPFAPTIYRLIDPNGFLWWGVTDEYEVVQQTLQGDTVRTMTKDFDPARVYEVELDSAMQPTRSFVENGGEIDGPSPPSTKPAYEWFVIDNVRHLWVRPFVELSHEGDVLDVFDPDLRLLGTVTADFSCRGGVLPIIKAKTFYCVGTDSLGVDHVIQARIVGRDREALRN